MSLLGGRIKPHTIHACHPFPRAVVPHTDVAQVTAYTGFSIQALFQALDVCYATVVGTTHITKHMTHHIAHATINRETTCLHRVQNIAFLDLPWYTHLASQHCKETTCMEDMAACQSLRGMCALIALYMKCPSQEGGQGLEGQPHFIDVFAVLPSNMATCTMLADALHRCTTSGRLPQPASLRIWHTLLA